MSKADYALLQDVITDDDFPDLDLALRRGRHVDRDDGAWYALLSDAQELLEPFYRRYGCELIHKTDGYFYLLPTNEKVSRKQLSATDMLVGQALALLYLDPAAVERGGVVTQEEVVAQLSTVLGTDTLIAAFNPGKRKSKDERISQRNVRQRVGEAVRRLAGHGFVELSDASSVRLRAALLRFAEPVRGLSEPAEALAKLVAQGEVALAPEEPGDALEEQDADGGERVEESSAAESGGAEVIGEESGERVDRSVAALGGDIAAQPDQEWAVAASDAPEEHTGDELSPLMAAAGVGETAASHVEQDETGVLRRPAIDADARESEDEGGSLLGDELAADGGEEDVTELDDTAAHSAVPPEDDGELDWANIMVPGVEKDGEEES